MNAKDNALRMAIEALEYHTEQTRPIQNTIDTLAVCKAALSDAVTLPDVAIALEERDKLGFTVVEVIGKLDEINEQVEEITLHDVNYFAIPAEIWHELQDALEEMPQRAELFTQLKVTLPDGWVSVPVEPDLNMRQAVLDWNRKNSLGAFIKVGMEYHVAELTYKAMVQAAPTLNEKG